MFNYLTRPDAAALGKILDALGKNPARKVRTLRWRTAWKIPPDVLIMQAKPNILLNYLSSFSTE
eukprot:scaffold72701_cov51-Phaeocystis_antarctica.AAC.2